MHEKVRFMPKNMFINIIRKTKRCEIVKRSVHLHKTKCCFLKVPSQYDKTPRNKKIGMSFYIKCFMLCLPLLNNLADSICSLFKCYLNIILTQHHISIGGVEVGVGIECGFGAAFERITEVAVLAHPVT